jgi:hypothetical protein
MIIIIILVFNGIKARCLLTIQEGKAKVYLYLYPYCPRFRQLPSSMFCFIRDSHGLACIKIEQYTR